MRRCVVFSLPMVPYPRAWSFQRALVDFVVANRGNNTSCDFLLLTQHPSVYTLGRAGDASLIRERDPYIPIYRVERGGEVTWHGAGQMIAYPILDLQQHKQDLHWYVRSLEKTVIETLADYDIQGTQLSINSGVWVNKNKICAVGISASRWVTMHGLALNVNCDLSNYDKIVPCGIDLEGYGVTSMEKELGNRELVDLPSVEQSWMKCFQEKYNVELITPHEFVKNESMALSKPEDILEVLIADQLKSRAFEQLEKL